MSSAESAKYAQLRKVFLKALDVTVESVRPQDISDCFGPMQGTLGHSLDGTVVKQLGKMKTAIEANFVKCCEKHQVSASLSSSNEGVQSDPIQVLQACAAELEIQQLQEAIALLKQKNAVLREDTLRLSSSAQEQISALRFESQKMEDAAEQCISV